MSIATMEVDAELVYEALDRKRRHLHMCRREVAEILGVSPPAYTYWSQGGGINADVLIRACAWLDCDARRFTKRNEVD